MHDRRRSTPQIWLAAVAGVSGVTLMIGVVTTLFSGHPIQWPIAAAIPLVASLTLLRSLRHTP